ncbi:MAG: PilZ domain-containing protein [Bryobacteraceae bacterium]
MAGSDVRRHRRVPYMGPIRLSWEDERGQPKFVQSKCLDISESGLRVETSQPIPLRTCLMLRAERINLSGAATVRHSQRYGAKYILGIELSQVLHDKTLAMVREPWALRGPVAAS